MATPVLKGEMHLALFMHLANFHCLANLMENIYMYFIVHFRIQFLDLMTISVVIVIIGYCVNMYTVNQYAITLDSDQDHHSGE